MNRVQKTLLPVRSSLNAFPHRRIRIRLHRLLDQWEENEERQEIRLQPR